MNSPIVTGYISLSIIVVGWNTLEHIQRCFSSIYKYPPPGRFELIYVDNASTDDSVDYVKKKHPQVIVIENKKNLGFQKANNQGLKIANGNYIVLLNSDTELLAGTFETMINFISEKPHAGSASPRCLYPDGRLQWAVAGFPSLKVLWWWFCSNHACLKWLCRLRKGVEVIDPAETREQDYSYGAFFMTKREVAKAIGPMDEGFFLAGGDVAWSMEIRKKGWKNYYVAEAKLIHSEEGSRKRSPKESLIDWIKAHRRLLYKYQGVPYGLLGELIFLGHILMNAVADSLFVSDTKAKRTNTGYWLQVLKSVYF